MAATSCAVRGDDEERGVEVVGYCLDGTVVCPDADARAYFYSHGADAGLGRVRVGLGMLEG